MKNRLNIDNNFPHSFLANIPLRFQLLDRQGLLQSSGRSDWVRSSPDQATYLLEYTILQDLPRYETRYRDEIVCPPHASQLSPLADRWWEISKDIQGSRHVEVVDWSESIVTETLQQRRVQRNEWLGPGSSKARIGILSNNENNCWSCDSRIGFGTGSPKWRFLNSNTCGNSHGYDAKVQIKTMGYILVQ